MNKLHVFGCSITQGFALPDVVQPIVDEHGVALTNEQIENDPNIHWSDIHLYQPSKYAWPQVLADRLGCAVENYARRGACYDQIARQAAVAAPSIEPNDVAVVMWTYNSRISLQWPARTTVPFCNIVDTKSSVWRTVITGLNKMMGLEHDRRADPQDDETIQRWIEQSTMHTWLNPMNTYDKYYRNLVLQTTVDGMLKNRCSRVIHLSVETEPVLDQLEAIRQQLNPTLQEPYRIPDPQDWYTLDVDYDSCRVILDPSIPTAENDMHPSVTHHTNFAAHIHQQYFA